MLLIDDILFSPVTSILWLFREIHKNAEAELSDEAASITQELRSLYMQLETGRLTPERFDAEEKILLDRLDALDTGGDQDDEEATNDICEEQLVGS